VACLAHLGFAVTGQSYALARQLCESAIAQAERHGWDAEPVIAPAQATLAGILVSTGEFDRGEEWLERARRATEAGGEPGLRLLIHLLTAILRAARGRHREALAELVAAEQIRARITGPYALSSRVTGWTIATLARLGNLDQARATLAAVDEQLATAGEIRNAAAAIHLAEHDPAAARRELQPVLDGTAPVNPYATVIEACLLEALACRDLGDESATRAAVERALHLAEPDRLIVPFAMTGAWELITALPPHGTSHAALVADILDAVHGDRPADASAPGLIGGLSPTELRVLRYLPTNLTRPEIAGELSVSLNTVNTHISRIYAKLGATDRSAAVQRGRDLRLLSSGRT
jgi:LuxR family maltose regulon positive regulatory protein